MFEYGSHYLSHSIAGKLAKPAAGATQKVAKSRADSNHGGLMRQSAAALRAGTEGEIGGIMVPSLANIEICSVENLQHLPIVRFSSVLKMEALMRLLPITAVGVFGLLHSAALAGSITTEMAPTAAGSGFDQARRPISNPTLFDLGYPPPICIQSSCIMCCRIKSVLGERVCHLEATCNCMLFSSSMP